MQLHKVRIYRTSQGIWKHGLSLAWMPQILHELANHLKNGMTNAPGVPHSDFLIIASSHQDVFFLGITVHGCDSSCMLFPGNNCKRKSSGRHSLITNIRFIFSDLRADCIRIDLIYKLLAQLHMTKYNNAWGQLCRFVLYIYKERLQAKMSMSKICFLYNDVWDLAWLWAIPIGEYGWILPLSHVPAFKSTIITSWIHHFYLHQFPAYNLQWPSYLQASLDKSGLYGSKPLFSKPRNAELQLRGFA